MERTYSIVIIGGGLAGLRFAWALAPLSISFGSALPMPRCKLALLFWCWSRIPSWVSRAQQGVRRFFFFPSHTQHLCVRQGGNSTKATSGINGAGTRAQLKAGVVDSPATFYEDTVKGARELARPELIKVLTHDVRGRRECDAGVLAQSPPLCSPRTPCIGWRIPSAST